MNTIRAGSKVLSPFVERCFVKAGTPQCANPGVEIIVIMRILRHAGLRLILKEYQTWDEMAEALETGQIDMLASTEAYPDPDYSQFTFPLPTNLDRPVFFIKHPGQGKNFQEILRSTVYNYEIWIFLGVAFVVAVLFRKIAVQSILKKLQNAPSRSKVQQWLSHNRLASGTVLLMLSFLVLNVILGIYGNTIAIILAKDSPSRYPFSSAAQLANLISSKQCKMIYYEYMFSEFGNDTELKQVFEAGGYNEEKAQPEDTDFEVAEMLVNSDTCLTFLDYKTKLPYYKLINQQLEVIEDLALSERQYAYYVRNSISKLNKEKLLRAYYGGSSEVVYAKELNNVVRRRGKSFIVWGHDRVHVKPLSLHQLGDVFMALGMCLAISVIALIIELGAYVPKRNLDAFRFEDEIQISDISLDLGKRKGSLSRRRKPRSGDPAYKDCKSSVRVASAISNCGSECSRKISSGKYSGKDYAVGMYSNKFRK